MTGMKIALWKAAVDERAHRGDGPTKISTQTVALEQAAASPASLDLAELYEAMNGSLVDLLKKTGYQAPRGNEHAYNFGFVLAEAATTGSGRLVPRGIRIPQFAIRFVGKGKKQHLQWEGEDPGDIAAPRK